MKNKKLLSILISVLVAASLFAGCAKKAEPTSEASTSAESEGKEEPIVTEAPTPEPTPEATTTPEPTPEPSQEDPWTETDDLAEAMKGSGLNFSPPVEQAIPKRGEETMQLWKYRWTKGTIEALYESVSDEMRIRASLDKSGDDLAGVYEEYSQTWDQTLKGLTVHCKGDGENISVATFDTEDVHYAITYTPEAEDRGITADELNSIVNSLQAGPYKEPTPTPEASGSINITADPTDETVPVNGSCIYIATAEGTLNMEWRFASPDGTKDLSYTEITQTFPSLVVEGGDQETMTISNIPKEMDGWKSYCRFKAEDGTMKDSGSATTHVEGEADDQGDSPYVGTYAETIAGRGTITVTKGEGNVHNVTVDWSGSAWDRSQWTFSGEFDGRGVLEYANCTKTTTTFDDAGNGTTIENYNGGSGYIQMADENDMYWVDNVEGAGADCTFSRS